MLGVSDLLRRPLARHDVRLRPPATGCLETSACDLHPGEATSPVVFTGKPTARELGSLTNGTERTKVSQREMEMHRAHTSDSCSFTWLKIG